MRDKNDILIFRLIQDNDEVALKYLFNKYFNALCRYINIYIKNKSDSEEIALDIFIYLWENRAIIKIETHLKAYLFRMAHNRSLNYLRDKKSHTSLNDLVDDVAYANIDSIELQELETLIAEAIMNLPPKCREVFEKSRHSEMSNKEIADEMQISVKTVETQISKALKKIKGYLDKSLSFLFLF